MYEIFDAIIDERLDEVDIKWRDGGAVCVVCASGGYPVKYESGLEITGIENAESIGDITVFHAGTKLQDGKIVMYDIPQGVCISPWGIFFTL